MGRLEFDNTECMHLSEWSDWRLKYLFVHQTGFEHKPTHQLNVESTVVEKQQQQKAKQKTGASHHAHSHRRPFTQGKAWKDTQLTTIM
jgi:hypothetical protein